MASQEAPITGQKAWARARLTRGSSGGAIWEINSDYPEARLTLGSDAGAGWPIVANGVHPIHCELFWDGTALWIADIQSVGGVFLDGERVTDWVQIRGPAELRFGQAALDFETSAALHERMASNPQHARPITLTDMVVPPENGRQSRPIFGGAAATGEESIGHIDDAQTRVVAAGDARPRRAAASITEPAQNSPDLRPRLGGNGASVQSEATKMVAMPLPPQAPVAHAPVGHAPAAVVAPPPPGMQPHASQPHAAQAMQHPSAAELAAAPFQEGGPSFVGPPTDQRPATPKANPFEDVLAKVIGVLKPQTSAEVLEKSGAKGKQSLPVRTWILLGITLAAAVGLLMWEEEPVEETATQAQTGTTVNVASQPPPTEPTVVPPVVPALPVPNPTGVPSPTGEPGSVPGAEGSEVPILTLQRRAADLYIAGSYAEALPLYQQLAQQAPQDPSYAAMVRILQRRMADRCRDGVGPGGEPCTD